MDSNPPPDVEAFGAVNDPAYTRERFLLDYLSHLIAKGAFIAFFPYCSDRRAPDERCALLKQEKMSHEPDIQEAEWCEKIERAREAELKQLRSIPRPLMYRWFLDDHTYHLLRKSYFLPYWSPVSAN